MMVVKTIVDKYTGKVLYCRVDEPTEENEIAINELLKEEMKNPYWDFNTNTFYSKN